jgi:hypothetical protein
MIENEIPKHRSKKNTRRWCRGKVGEKHTPMWHVWKALARQGRVDNPMLYVCQSCGKHIDYWFAPLSRYSKPIPRPVEGSCLSLG